MTDLHCEAARRGLALGETDGLERHLAACEDCRVEAETVRRLLSLLADDDRLEPPPALDARVRSLLAAAPFGILLRPWLAGGLAVASFVALVSTLAVVLSYTAAAEYAPLLALGVGSAYLALSAAATLPLMMQAAGPRARPTEVGT